MYSFSLLCPDVVPVAFSRAAITLELKEKGPDIEIDYAEFLEMHQSMFVQPYLDEIGELASRGAFGCTGPVSVRLDYPSTRQGQIEIAGTSCPPTLLSAVLNLLDHMNRRSEHPGPYKAARLTVSEAVDARPYPLALDKGEFPVSSYGEFRIAMRGEAADPFALHDLKLVFKEPSAPVPAPLHERLTGLYEGLNACGLWMPRAYYPRWAGVFTDDCEVSLHQYRSHGELDVRDHLGPLSGLLDLMRALGAQGGDITVMTDQGENAHG